ncbi:MAG: Rne/Rng family ribonuclease [Microbacterium gubbeenense]|uniref:Rne/Rng family ribonuclease n=1 Tax=Microbacterium gubbeenense TaxID=159896 RepID=UPI0004141CAF|nr:Rne/Rng family ribonuclease [Microbacterium gubbeenense]
MAEEKNDTSTPTQDVRPDESDEQAREQEAATAAAEQAGKTQDDSGEPEIPTAVGLGLIEKDFVSRVSTVLNFYAPDPRLFPPVTSFDDHFRDDRYRDNDNDFDDRRSDGNRSSRRRRRRGGPASEEREHDEPREQRSRGRVAEVITEPQSIKGSTRLEAKKQRRRDGRDAGRRRTVVTEAEFLARRESVDRQMIVRSKQNRTQIGVLEDGVLVEHYVARAQEASLIGNIYLGRVQNVLPSMEAAFVDIGRGRNAVLYSGEVDWDAVETGNQPRRIELALKPGDKVLVQVSKDPVGHKGARLTSQISLPGRYLVYVPGGSMNGISRKLPDTERARLKKILKKVLPEHAGVIVRTAAEGATEEQLTRDVNHLAQQWEHVRQQVEKGAAPKQLHSEPDLLVKIVRDVFNEDFQKMVIQGAESLETIKGYLESVAPDLLERIVSHEGDADPFDEHRITEQIEKALDRKVWLPSGGSLVIDRTEAMTVVDVNTGKFVGSGGNLEETVTKNNLEAAEEIVRQLRLRDIGGIIVVDFIDMVLESNRDLVLRRLIECLSRDRTKHQVAEVTSLGLVQMTRKKIGLGLLETFSEPCEVCAGRGVVVHHDPVMKHRTTTSSNGRRSRGSSSNGGSGGGRSRSQKPDRTPESDDAGAPVNTEGAKNALAKIAASTIVGHDHDAPAAQPEKSPVVQPSSLDQLATVLPEGPRGVDKPAEKTDERARKPRRRRANDAGSKPANGSAGTNDLLDSVLSALPEPKAPGQGRSRRRVSTAALQGTAVTVTPQSDEG